MAKHHPNISANKLLYAQVYLLSNYCEAF